MNDEKNNSKPRQLVGLQYEVGDGLPTVIVKASGARAEELIRRHNVYDGPPLVEDAGLAQALFRLPVDAPIGKELFTVVAALLTHVYSIDAKLEGHGHA